MVGLFLLIPWAEMASAQTFTRVEIEGTDAAISYPAGTWAVTSGAAMSGGAARTNNPDAVGDAVQFSCSCTQVRIGMRERSSSGNWKVSLDGVQVKNASGYAATTADQVLFYDSGVIADGPHTLKLEVTGAGAPGTGLDATADFFEYVPGAPPPTTTTTTAPTTTTTTAPTTTTTAPTTTTITAPTTTTTGPTTTTTAPTTTTTTEPTTTTTAPTEQPDLTCQWEDGGQPEANPEPCHRDASQGGLLGLVLGGGAGVSVGSVLWRRWHR
jgi:hypothetical protein